MRLLIVDQFGEMGGAQRCLVDIAAGFAERGWEMHAAVPEGDLMESLRPLCLTVRALTCGPFHSSRKTVADAVRMAWQIVAQQRTMRRLLRELAPDLLYVNGPRLMPAAALAHGSIPVLFHAHSIVEQRAAALLLAASLRMSNAWVAANSRHTGDPLRRMAGRPVRVAPNGVRDCAARRQTNGRFTVGVLGRIAEEKGQLEFVRAARLVLRSLDCRFAIGGAPMFCGTDYLERVRREARGLDIEWAGWVDDAAAFLARVDLLVVPSTRVDATPRVIAEAFSAGTPVLACAVGGIPEIIRDGRDGLLVADRSPGSLARAIMAAAGDRERLRAIAANARARWREAFTVERFQADIAAFVQEAVERNHQRSPVAKAGAIVEA